MNSGYLFCLLLQRLLLLLLVLRLAAGGCWWLLVAAAADAADAEGNEVLAGGSETAKHHRPKGRNDL